MGQNDFYSRAAVGLIPVVLAIAGWAYSLDSRLREVSARQEERGPRLTALEQDVSMLQNELGKPSSRVEEKLDLRVSRLEERMNNLHLFIIQLQGSRVRRGELETPPPPFRQFN